MPARISGKTCINHGPTHLKPARFGDLCVGCWRAASPRERAEQAEESVPTEMLTTLNEIRNLNEALDDPDST